MLLKKKEKLPAVKGPAGAALELLPSALVRGDSAQQKLLRYVLTNANMKNIKRLGAAALGASAALALAGSIARRHMIRAALSKELKKQLAPVNKKLDELEEQNKELKKQNEQLRKQLK